MESDLQNNIGTVVAADYRSATVFETFGIDYCCNGNRSIVEACATAGIDPEKLREALLAIPETKSEHSIDFQSWPPDLLADYIEKTHHRYVTAKISELMPLLEKIVRVHGEQHPELLTIQSLFGETAGALTQHMKKEELILFPFIREMMRKQIQQESLEPVGFGTVQNPIAMMHREHDDEGKRFRTIAALSNNYTAPEDACTTYKLTYALLKEFEADLHLHIHLENNILFPKAIELEEKLATA